VKFLYGISQCSDSTTLASSLKASSFKTILGQQSERDAGNLDGDPGDI